MWKLAKHKSPTGDYELHLQALIVVMSNCSLTTNSESFENEFQRMLKHLASANFTDENNYKIFKVTPRNDKSVEIWRMSIEGDYQDKLYTLTFEADAEA